MKCEECLPLIEEYFDGELTGRAAARVAAHLETCAACARELAEYERDAEVYARYERELEVGPASWNIVRARIEQERDARPSERRRGGWLAALFGAGRGFRPALVAALVLLAIGASIGVIYLSTRRHPSEMASNPQRQNATPAPSVNDSVRAPDARNQNPEVAAINEGMLKNEPGPMTAGTAERTRAAKRSVAVAALPKSASRRNEQSPLNESARFEETVASPDNTVASVRRYTPEAGGDFDSDVARHAERAELLLRSFRNARPAAPARSTLDVSYEKENARKLLYQNIALRRDAETRGDQTAADLLNTLEPILLDIAHLPSHAKPADVRPIEERMKKKEIVAALQVRTLVASY